LRKAFKSICVCVLLLMASPSHAADRSVIHLPNPFETMDSMQCDSVISLISLRHFKDSTDTRLIRQLAEAYTARARRDSAISYWSLYASLQPGCDTAYAELASLYYDSGAKDSAASAIQRALSMHPSHIPYLMLSATIAYQLKHYDRALSDYDRILSHDPNNVNALMMSGIILRNQNKQLPAFDRFDKCVKAAPSNTDALLYRAESFVLQKKYDAALKDYTAARADLSANADILNNIGICHQALGNYQIAISYFKKAILANRNHPQSYFNKGISHYHLHDLDTATLDIQTASAIWDSCHSDSACRASFLDAVYYLALCSKKTGNLDSAKKYFELLQRNGYSKNINDELKEIDRTLFISLYWYYIVALFFLLTGLIIAIVRLIRR